MVDSDDFDSNDGSGVDALDSAGEEAVKTAGIMRNAAQLLEEERNKAFYQQLDERIDHIINGLVQPVVYDRENGTIFIVRYQGQSLRMHFSPMTKTFGDVQKMAASYFGLPHEIVFLSDQEDRGVIYMHEQNLRDELFPLQTAYGANETPILYLILQRKMTAVDFLDNGRDLKEAAAEAVGEV